MPPATSTLPLARSVAVNKDRPVAMLPVAVQVFVLGSYRSALDSALLLELSPPTTSTWPLGSRTALAWFRASDMFPADDQVPVAGSYSSALARLPLEEL